ncbi:MBL fold metallo-hydrolase [Mesonia ostreae]|uniref:MBL fold metallo-hydrolase n=1 Tax=Mesonia ostreae TaxID=861110 RepID=A0ABU2KJW0_9FLAO|nr:MBL fold metallo-hydrolase [Mesonia ostreae]MDT0294954.1 MBL fold metallo-hydrolase [Mesonia ostreae]
MKNIRLLLACTLITLLSCKNEPNKKMDISDPVPEEKEEKDEVKITPIEHASMILSMGDFVLYIDPTGEKKDYQGHQAPTHILITDIHGDHFDMKMIKYIFAEGVKIIAPKAVADQLPEKIHPNTIMMENGDEKKIDGLLVEAIPMYNTRKEALEYHPKGRGNGYVVSWEEERIYISGDTEDIPEMRNLKGITKAFVCMNLPYTMPVSTAADAVLDFEPEVVYPYHYRGDDGYADVRKFANIIKTNRPNTKVELLTWYKDEPKKKKME